MLFNKNYYAGLIKNYPDNILSPYENLINLDLERTFPADPFFQDEKNLKKLKNILLAFSRRESTIGYCQGFNFIVGKILKIFEDEVNIMNINFNNIIGGNFLGFFKCYR
jgi:hypothetical protein